MIFELNLITLKLMLEKTLVDLLWSYHTASNITLIPKPLMTCCGHIILLLCWEQYDKTTASHQGLWDKGYVGSSIIALIRSDESYIT
jgi:hypothetical protein